MPDHEVEGLRVHGADQVKHRGIQYSCYREKDCQVDIKAVFKFVGDKRRHAAHDRFEDLKV